MRSLGTTICEANEKIMFKTEIVKARTFGEIAKINEELAKKKNAMQETLAVNEEANKLLAELYEIEKKTRPWKSK